MTLVLFELALTATPAAASVTGDGPVARRTLRPSPGAVAAHGSAALPQEQHLDGADR